jgi:hypothetical protein
LQRCNNDGVAAALLLQHCYCYDVTLLQRRCCCGVAMMALLLWRGSDGVVVALLWRCCCGVAAMMLLLRHCSDDIAARARDAATL